MSEDNLVQLPTKEAGDIVVIDCVVCIPVFGDRIMLLRRGPQDKIYANQWRLPGGMCKKEESNQESIARILSFQSGLDTSLATEEKFLKKYKTIYKSDGKEYHIFAHVLKFDFPKSVRLSDKHSEMYFADKSEIEEMELAGKVTESVIEDYYKSLEDVS